MSNFIQIPEDLHKSYIDNALANGITGYKYWTFKNLTPENQLPFPEYTKKQQQYQKNISDTKDEISSIDKKQNQLYKQKAKIKKSFSNTEEASEIYYGQTDDEKSSLKEQRKTAKRELGAHIKSLNQNFNNTVVNYYPFSDTFTDFLNNTYYGENEYHSNFFDNIPTVTVRGYVPETILGFLIDLIGIGIESITDNPEYQNATGIFNKMKATLKIIGEKATSFFTKTLENMSSETGYDSIIAEIVNGINGDISTGLNSLNEAYDNNIIKMPYILYYKILKAKTNNIYEFPAILNNIFKSNSYGWSNGYNLNLGSMIGGPLGFLTNTIGTTITPIFDPRNSGSEEPAGFTINLDLVNDTIDHAIQNYNLVQSLVLYNMWVQYGFVQGPGSLYDIKIAGGQRFLMCTGNFSVTNKGMLRKIQGAVDAGNWLPWKEETRIPDIYSLNLEFKSLLPNNLNNYMISICTGNTMTDPGTLDDDITKTIIDNVRRAFNK